MSVLLLLFFIMASYVCIRVGAVAFELTGIPWEQAKFQALSAFTNSGFTTRESEDIVQHPLRRRIASTLIILGNAGIVTTMGSFASTLMGNDVRGAAMDFGYIAGGLFVLAWLARRPFIAERLRVVLQRWLSARYEFAPTAEAALRFDEGYSMFRVHLPASSPAAGSSLKDLRLLDRKIQILAIERGRDFIPVPSGDDVIRAEDVLIVYGVLSAVDDALHPDDAERMTLVTEHLEMSVPIHLK